MARKAFSLSTSEQQHYQQLEGEHQRLTAQFGALTLEMEEVRKALAMSQEKQRVLVTAAILRQGVTQFNAARIEGPNLICEVPESALEPIPNRPTLINGAPQGGSDGVAREE